MLLSVATAVSAYQLPGGVPRRRGFVRPAAGRVRMVAPADVSELDAGVVSPSVASFNNTWYAVAFSEQLGSTKPLGTRLWGEPIVLYRDAEGEVVAAKDVCPHRSAPLSMGDVEDGVLRCFYHGWGFGAKGQCVDVPTMTSSGEKKALASATFCATNFAVVEQDGMVFVWRGNPLTADARKLPKSSIGADDIFVCDTILDYGVGWPEVVQDKLMMSHLSRLREGLMPQLEQVGEGASNVVRYADAQGFGEELHVMPVAQQRTRVMLRQRFPKGPIQSSLLQLPGAGSLLTFIVRNRNYQLAVEDFKAEGQPRTAAGAEKASRFCEWVREAHEAEAQPFFTRWDGVSSDPRVGQQTDDSSAANTGTYGLKRSYVQDLPAPDYAPMSYAPYKEFHDTQNQAIKETAVTGAVSVPAALLTYKTVVPAMASLATLDLFQ